MGKEVIASRQNVFQLVPCDLIIRRSLQIVFRGQATTHTNARTVGKTIPASHNSRFHSIWALEMDTLPWGSKHKQAMAACNQATLKTYLCLRKVILSQNSVRDWVTVSVRQWRRVVYHISHVLGDIIQPAGDSSVQIITGTGVYFISPINALEWWYSTPPFDSFCFLSFPTTPSGTIKCPWVCK